MKRLYFFTFFFLLLALLLFAITCKKEFSYEGGGMAEYTLVDYPNACYLAIVDTNYHVGVPTDSTNHASVNIQVTRPGKYIISTDVVDGISFSNSGVVDSLYMQYGLLLYAHGTPDSAGTFTFHIPGTTGCYFSVTVTDQPGASYTLSGAPNDCSNPVALGQYIQGIATTSANVITINIDVIATGKYNITTNNVNGITFSATGTFTSTGTQQVVLQATGMPGETELSQFTLNGRASQCTFYLPVANPEPLATYVLQSAIENNIAYCAPGSAQGTYTAGMPLTASNTITVNAYVTVPGNFTISTTEQDGIKFSYTGTFATIGAQNVVLKGSGTPLSSGTNTFYPQIVGPAPLGGSTCGLDVIVQ